MEKIKLLKGNIDPNLKEDPLSRLKKAQANSNNKLSIRCTDSNSLKKTILKKMKKKKSSGFNAQRKLLEVWKSINNKNYQIIWEKDPKIVDARTRSIQKESLIVVGKGLKLQSTFYSDAARLWNKLLDAIKNSKSLCSAKKEIKKFIWTLPI